VRCRRSSDFALKQLNFAFRSALPPKRLGHLTIRHKIKFSSKLVRRSLVFHTKDINGLEPRLTREGYNTKTLVL
jgi:hypothetical protein